MVMAVRRSLHKKKTVLDHDEPDKHKVLSLVPFHFKLWLFLTVENWLFDFGRPIYALYSSDWFPLSMPSIGDYCHMAYNVATALCVLYLLDKCSRPVPKYLQYCLVAVFVLGASIHLVGDSVQHRLVHIGYKLHLPLTENPVMHSLHPPSLLEFFKLLEFYDEHLGHWLWYIPLFTAYVLMVYGGLVKERSAEIPTCGWLLLGPSALFEWYMVTEGQIIVPFLTMMVVMAAIRGYWSSEYLDSNGQWLLLRGLLTLLLIVIWVLCLWNDKDLRKKYPGILYVPEPWSFVSLYFMD